MTTPKNKTVLVTGGSRGIGAGICKVLLEHGDYRVIAGYCQHRSGAEKTVKGFSNGDIIQVDVGNKLSVDQAFKSLGNVDILVNNAAIGEEKPFLELTDADWEDTFSVNLYGAVRCSQHVLPHMLQQKYGRIINISSIAGQWGGVYRVHYAATKAALINLTQSLAKLYSSQGITVNAIAPGLVATDLTAAELAKPEGQEKLKNIPIGRLATPEEVGHAVRYLISDEAAYLTGQTLNLNGGMYFG